MSQQPPADDSYGQPHDPPPPPGPSTQPPSPEYSQPGYSQGPQGYGQPAYPGGGYPGTTGGLQFDLAKIVSIGAWVVLGLYALFYLYGLGQDSYGEDVADRLFGLMPDLGEGIFFSGLLHAVAAWLGRNA